MKALVAALLVAASMLGAGCGARMAVVSTEKTAFVVRQGTFSTDVHRCTAESGKPICTQVEER